MKVCQRFISKYNGINTISSSLLGYNITRNITTFSDANNTDYIIGEEITDYKLDFSKIRIGETLDIPYEISVSSAWKDIWQSVFYQQDRFYTSYDYAEKMKGNFMDAGQNRGIPLPFTLILFTCTSMSHVDDSTIVYDLGYRNVVYNQVAFENDTLKRRFTILNIRESITNKDNIIIDILCRLYNQKNELLFRCIKTMYFKRNNNRYNLPKHSDNYDYNNLYKTDVDFNKQSSTLKKFILKNSFNLQTNNLGAITPLRDNQLILHSLQRPIGYETNMNICMLNRMTHPLIYNNLRYNNNNIVSSVPLIAMTHSIASKEFYEVLYEELLDCHLVNTCSPNECIGAITFIRKIEDETQDLDNIECVTLGIKNIDIRNELKNIKIPMNLFEPGLFSKKIQDICKEYIPILHNNIIVHSTRKLYRHKSSKQSIPLL